MEESGRIELVNDEIVYTPVEGGGWRLRLDEVRVFGEYTNQDGPGLDDWFFAFLRAADEYWFEAPVYADGRDQLMNELCDRFGIDTIECKLAHSTDFDSRVMWPRVLAEQPLFQFTERRRDGLLRNIFGTQRVDQVIAPAVVKYLEEHSNATSGD